MIGGVNELSFQKLVAYKSKEESQMHTVLCLRTPSGRRRAVYVYVRRELTLVARAASCEYARVKMSMTAGSSSDMSISMVWSGSAAPPPALLTLSRCSFSRASTVPDILYTSITHLFFILILPAFFKVNKKQRIHFL